VTAAAAEKHTTVRLAEALAEIPGMPREIVQRAVDGAYHDYLSDLAFPALQLCRDLVVFRNRRATHGTKAWGQVTALIERVKQGEFDATKAEADAWVASPAVRAGIAQLCCDGRGGELLAAMGAEGRDA
jgi:hypothetical protein